jgi:hypothetical protein
LDVRTAELHDVPFNVSYLCPDYKPGSGSGLAYRLDSRLLIVNGAIEDPGGDHRGTCGTLYFEWDGQALKPIQAANGKPKGTRAN